MADTQARAITALIDYIAALEDRYGTAIRMLADEVEAVNKTASATRQAAELLADEIERTNETAAGVTHALGSVGELFKQKADIGSLESVGKMTMNSLRKTQSDLADLRKQLNELKDIDPTVEMRVEKGMIQYRGKDGWKNLISKEELRGPRGLTGGGGSAPNPGGDTPSTGGAVESVNGKTGKVVLGVDDIPQLRNQLNARVEKEDGKGLIPLDELERLSGLQNYDDTALREELVTATAEIAALQENDIETAQQVDALAEQLGKKVDAVEGMQLIATTEVERLAGVTNYDDTAVKGDVSANAALIEAMAVVVGKNSEDVADLKTASHTHGNKAVLDSVTQANVDLVNALDDASAVSSQGITMRKPFNADGNAVTGLPNPVNPMDAVPYAYMVGMGKAAGEYVTDANDAVKPGFYSMDGNTANRVDGSVLYVNGIQTTNGVDVHQTAIGGYTELRRYFSSWAASVGREGWQPWEYVNPPMQENVLYRTTERYMGRAVYAKVVNVGKLPNTARITKTDSDLTGAVHVCHCSGFATGSSQSLTFPSYDEGKNGIGCWAYTNGNICVAATYNASAYTGYVLIKFTK